MGILEDIDAWLHAFVRLFKRYESELIKGCIITGVLSIVFFAFTLGFGDENLFLNLLIGVSAGLFLIFSVVTILGAAIGYLLAFEKKENKKP